MARATFPAQTTTTPADSHPHRAGLTATPRWMLGAVATLSFAGVACGGGDLAGTLGQLGEGVFRYDCVEDGDARCNTTGAIDSLTVSRDLGIDPELPTAVAVGARFDLTFVGDTITDDGEFLVIDVEPARSDLVSQSGGFVIEAEGTFAFLARNGPKGITTDFVHLDAFSPAAIDVWHQEQKAGSITLEFGGEAAVASVAVADNGTALAGALPFRWSSSDPSIVAIATVDSSTGSAEVNDDEVRLVAVAEGTVTVTVTEGDLTQQIAVTVSPEVMP